MSANLSAAVDGSQQVKTGLHTFHEGENGGVDGNAGAVGQAVRSSDT